MEKILTVNDVAAILQVKAITVREMFREKRIRGFKVGKAWRTTEIMLREDIDALARGEAPAELPSPSARSGAGSTPPAPAEPKRPPVPAPAESAPPSAPAPPAEPELAQPAAKPKKKTPEKPVDPAGEKGDDEDTQQFLF